jgi:hypothetical protein
MSEPTPEENAAAKQRAIDACAAENMELLQCFRTSWFPICKEQNDAFWACYKRERGFLKLGLPKPPPFPKDPSSTS